MTAHAIADLRGCAAKLRRADNLFAELDGLALAFIQGNPYQAEREVDPDTDEVVYRLTEDVRQPPSDEWGPLIGDIAHNLRSALDHLVCQLSMRNGGDPDCSTTEFPIFDNDPSSKQIKDRIGSLDAADQKLILDLQPYQSGKDAWTDPLWLLRRINNIDKHRRLHLVSTNINERRIHAMQFVALSIEDILINAAGAKKGDELVRFHPENVRAEGGEAQLGPIVLVTFSDPGGALDRVSVRTVFPEITTHLRTRVFPTFEHRVGNLLSV